jgi:hypothetical protein
MSVIIMLALTWWGLIGFISVAAAVAGLLSQIEEEFGRKAYYCVLLLIGMLLMHLGSRERRMDLNTAKAFMASWSAESRGWPDGQIYTDSMWSVVDFPRSQHGDVPNDERFVLKYRLLSYTPVRQIGLVDMPLREDIHMGLSAKVVKSKVFASDLMLSSELFDGVKHAHAKFWVAMDNNKIVKIIFDDN